MDERVVSRAHLSGVSKTLYWTAQGRITADHLKMVKVSLDFTDGSRYVKYLSDMEVVAASGRNCGLTGHQNLVCIHDDVVSLLVEGRVYTFPSAIFTVEPSLENFFDRGTDPQRVLELVPIGIPYPVTVVPSPTLA